jgi:hypothetical protein
VKQAKETAEGVVALQTDDQVDIALRPCFVTGATADQTQASNAVELL